MTEEPVTRKFAFLVHPRNLQDLRKKFSFLRFVPDRMLEKLLYVMPPITVARITGLKDKNGALIEGILMAIAPTAYQMLDRKDVARRHVLKALKRAKDMGATHAGLGALTSVVTEGGKNIRGHVSGIAVTNGNALTAHIAFVGVQQALKEHGMHKPRVAVVGATGSIGAAVTELITRDLDFEELYIVGRTPASIEALQQRLAAYPNAGRVHALPLEDAIPKSDCVILATSASSVVIDAHMPKQGAIVYDITQPKNTSPTFAKERPDVSLYDGGLVLPPPGVEVKYNMGIPRGQLFACMAETMLLSIEHYPSDYCLGHVTIEQATYAAELAERYGFTPAPLRRL